MPGAAHRLPARRRPETGAGATGANAIDLATSENRPARGTGDGERPRLKGKRSEGALLSASSAGGAGAGGRSVGPGASPSGRRQGLRAITRKVASDDNMRASAARGAEAVDGAASGKPAKDATAPAGKKPLGATAAPSPSVPAPPAAGAGLSTLIPSPSLPPKPAFLPGLPGLPAKPTFAPGLPAGKPKRGAGGLKAAASHDALRTVASVAGAQSAQSATLTPSSSEGTTAQSTQSATSGTSGNRYPASLSRQASAPLLRSAHANLPARPEFDQFSRPNGQGQGQGKSRTPSPASTASGPHAAGAVQASEQAPRRSSGGRRGGKGRNKRGEAGKQRAGTHGTTGGEEQAANTAEDAMPQADEISNIALHTAENVQSSSPAPLPDSAPASKRAPPSPSPAGIRGETGHPAAATPHRKSAAQTIPRKQRATAQTSAPTSPVPNSYQSLEDLLSQAGYRETRVFTPEAEKLRSQRREAEERRLAREARPKMQAYVADESRPAVVSPPFQDMATFPDVEGASPPVNGASWWNALAMPWTAGPVQAPSAAPEDAIASLQNALRADTGAAAKAVRRMFSANDVATSSRSTGFNWADESFESIVAPLPAASSRPGPTRHWSDTATHDGTSWGDGSPIKRKRKVLNRVDLEISLATTASTQSSVVTTDASEQSIEWTLHSEPSALDLSPTSVSDAGTIKPSKVDQQEPINELTHARVASVVSANGFDALAYERQSGEFDDLVGLASEAGSSVVNSPERPTKAAATKSPSPASSKNSPTRKILKHAVSVPALPCSGTAEWDAMLASLPPLPPVPVTAPIKPVTRSAARPAPPPRALSAVLSAPKKPASPMLIRSAHIVCDSNQAEDLPPLASPTEETSNAQGPSMLRTLRSVMSLSALRYRKQEVAVVAAASGHEREGSLALTLTPKLGLASDAQERVPAATLTARPHGFNVLYNRQASSPKYKYTDNIDEVEALNAAMEHEYLRKEPDFTQSFFYQPPTPPRPPGEAGPADKREAKRQRSIKSLRAHLLKKTVSSVVGSAAAPPVPPLPANLQKAQPVATPRRNTDRPPPPVFAISSPGATEAGLPPRELLLEGEEWDAGSFEGMKQREAAGLAHGKRLTKRPSLKKTRSGERRV